MIVPGLYIVDCLAVKCDGFKIASITFNVIISLSTILVYELFIDDYSYWYRIMSVKVKRNYLEWWESEFGKEHIPSEDAKDSPPERTDIPVPKILPWSDEKVPGFPNPANMKNDIEEIEGLDF